MELLTNSFKDIILNEPLNIRIFYQKKENILTVPLKAVVKRKINNIIKTYIYFIDKDNKVTEKEVYTGINNGEKVEIYGIGIDKGQEIIVNPDDKLQNNVIVKRRSLEDEELARKKKLKKLEVETAKKKEEIEKDEIEIIRLKKGK